MTAFVINAAPPPVAGGQTAPAAGGGSDDAAAAFSAVLGDLFGSSAAAAPAVPAAGPQTTATDLNSPPQGEASEDDAAEVSDAGDPTNALLAAMALPAQAVIPPATTTTTAPPSAAPDAAPKPAAQPRATAQTAVTLAQRMADDAAASQASPKDEAPPAAIDDKPSVDNLQPPVSQGAPPPAALAEASVAPLQPTPLRKVGDLQGSEKGRRSGLAPPGIGIAQAAGAEPARTAPPGLLAKPQDGVDAPREALMPTADAGDAVAPAPDSSGPAPGSPAPGLAISTSAANAAPPAHEPTAGLRGSPETVATLAAGILKKLDERFTRFDLELEPAGLGRVDVRIEIGQHGHLTAAMSFDTPQAAAELRSRAGELQKALEQSGFDLSGGLSFDVAGDQGRSNGWAQQQQQQAHTSESGASFRGRAFQAALDSAAGADAPASSINLRRGWRTAVDIRI